MSLILDQQVGSTRYMVERDWPRNEFRVIAHTVQQARTVASADALGPDDFVRAGDSVRNPELRHIPAVDEKFFYRVNADMFDGDEQERATNALAEAMRSIQPKVEENERRRLAGEQTLQEYEAELRDQERDRQRKLAFIARAAEREAQRQQEELESLPGYGMF